MQFKAQIFHPLKLIDIDENILRHACQRHLAKEALRILVIKSKISSRATQYIAVEHSKEPSHRRGRIALFSIYPLRVLRSVNNLYFTLGES